MSSDAQAGPVPSAEQAASRLPQRRRLADDIYQLLKEDLLGGTITPGARLNVDDLARQLQVSNTPVRQALAHLVTDGLVATTPYRGFAASQLLDARTVEELYDYRLLIEPHTACRAARRRTEADLEQLEALCARVVDLEVTDSSSDHFRAWDAQFHIHIAEYAGNRVVLENLEGVMTRMSVFMMYNRPDAADRAWKEHQEILAAIRSADADAATAAMRNHLDSSRGRFRTLLGGPDATTPAADPQ